MPDVRKIPEDDDELEPLPPMDGEGDELAEEDEELEAVPEDGGSALDDSTGEDDPLEEEDFGEDESSAIGDDADGLKDAADDITHFDGDAAPFAAGDDAPGIGEDDLGIDEDTPDVSTKDGGEEGLDEDGEELRAEDLPPLDADDEAEQADDGFFDRLVDSGDGGLSWDPHPWELVLAHAMEGVSALAAGDRGAFVFAHKLVWLDEAGAAHELAASGLGGNVTELTFAAGVLDAVVEGGRVLRSTDEGASFAALDEIRTSPKARPADAPTARFEQDAGRALVVAAGRIVADVSNDADIDGEDARILVLERRGELVWVATRAAVLAYRAA